MENCVKRWGCSPGVGSGTKSHGQRETNIGTNADSRQPAVGEFKEAISITKQEESKGPPHYPCDFNKTATPSPPPWHEPAHQPEHTKKKKGDAVEHRRTG